VNSAGERGLLGIAFDPNFASNQFVYLYYTATTPTIHNRISRFTANGDVLMANSEMKLLDLNDLSSATNHNGGAMHFGTDGKLYAGVGENANGPNAQTLTNLLGKLLRINTDPANLIPPDNPFVGTASGNNQAIWALGLRNPFTFAVQQGTGRIFINDVGENTWEEIDDGMKGGNYGWPNNEGGMPNIPGDLNPIFTYMHGSGLTAGNAITGGTFYNPGTANFPPEFTGRYFFSDYTNNWIRQLDPANNNSVTAFASGYSGPVELQVGPDGALYVLEHNGGTVHRVTSTQNLAPSITTQPASQTVTAGQTGTFSAVASGSPTLTYQWRKNTQPIGGATLASYTTPPATLSDNGAQFDCVVTNPYGNATSNAATLTVVANQAPAGTITAPAAGTQYQGGQTINFAGTASDPEEGSLPASAFSWQVDLYHGAGTLPTTTTFSGVKSGSFDVSRTAETSPDAFYRITLTVHDSQGLTNVTTRDVLPFKVSLTLNAISQGNAVLSLTLNGTGHTEPYSFTAVAGMIHSIGAPSPQVVNGRTYNFVSWSDGGAQTHNITVPASSTTYTAKFRRQ
jgi:glucose/arabinose dehydrogenase